MLCIDPIMVFSKPCLCALCQWISVELMLTVPLSLSISTLECPDWYFHTLLSGHKHSRSLVHKLIIMGMLCVTGSDMYSIKTSFNTRHLFSLPLYYNREPYIHFQQLWVFRWKAGLFCEHKCKEYVFWNIFQMRWWTQKITPKKKREKMSFQIKNKDMLILSVEMSSKAVVMVTYLKEHSSVHEKDARMVAHYEDEQKILLYTNESWNKRLWFTNKPNLMVKKYIQMEWSVQFCTYSNCDYKIHTCLPPTPPPKTRQQNLLNSDLSTRMQYLLEC